MLEDLDQMFAWLLAVLVRPTSGLYGEYDLREDDRDPGEGVTARYGGLDRPELTGTHHVRDLHRDLRELGFLLAPGDATTFTRATRWAVQEFQRYAALPEAATQRLPETATLTEVTTATASTIKVSALSAFPATPPFRVRIDAETLEVTAVAPGGELTVTRGAEDTTAAAHGDGASVALIRWSDRLVPVTTRFYERYPEVVTGVVNPWTRFVLRRWRRTRRRCPIVVEAWQVERGGPGRLFPLPAAGNVWSHEDVPSKEPRFYVRDLTRTWRRDGQPAVPGHPELDVTGDFYAYQAWKGPRAWPNSGHTWRSRGEMLPEHLLPVRPGGTGPTLADLVADEAGLSTYKVVRAVAEVEAVGFFDGLNAYDPAFISLGPCHWTAGAARAVTAGSPVEDGELWGFLSYLKAVDPAAFEQAVGRYGVAIATAWGRDGGELFLPGQRKYATRPTVPQENGPARPLPQVVEEFDVFRGWHWFYRFQMATRTVDGFRRRMWHMARIRIRDLAETPWDGPAGPPTWTVPDGSGGRRPARVKDVISSERGIAMVYRWHIKRPSHMVSGGPATEPPDARRTGRAGPQLRAVYEEAAKQNETLFTSTPDQWGDAAERALIAQLLVRPKNMAPPDTGLSGSLQYVNDWPRYGANPRGYTLPVELLPEAEDGERRALMTARGSFVFDGTDLPPAPF